MIVKITYILIESNLLEIGYIELQIKQTMNKAKIHKNHEQKENRTINIIVSFNGVN